MPTDDRLALNIRAARVGRGLTQEEATGLMGLASVTTYVRYERAERRPSIETLVKLAEGLGTTPSELLHGVGVEAVDDDLVEEGARLLRGMAPGRREAALRMLHELAALP